MSYFKYFPLIEYKGVASTNIMARVILPPSLVNSKTLYHPYQVEDGDRPDTIADLYYDDSGKDWLIRIVNNIYDEATDWPLTQNQLNRFIDEKYTTFNAYSTIKQYKLRTDMDAISSTTYDGLSSELKIYWTLKVNPQYYYLIDRDWTITAETYANLGAAAPYWAPQTYADYEFDLNEAKRNIKLVDRRYADEFEDILRETLDNV